MSARDSAGSAGDLHLRGQFFNVFHEGFRWFSEGRLARGWGDRLVDLTGASLWQAQDDDD